jgi:hypothetical protein
LLVRLFLGADELDEETVAAALAEAGLLELRAGRVRAAVRIEPSRDLLVVSDHPRDELVPGTDHVRAAA